MLALLVSAVLLQTEVNLGVGPRNDSCRPGRAGDSARVCTERPQRVSVTARHLATAFRDSSARRLLTDARAARLRLDSSIVSYDAKAYQRISAGLSVGRLGRDRLIFRTENASRIRWHRDVGAWIDVTGARTVIPIVPRDGQKEARDEVQGELDHMVPLPYYPGQEPLWIGAGLVKAEVNERELIHPLAEGSEAYYTYESGDTASLRLPDARVIRIRELRVRPRATRWNLAVGSLWFDADRGQLVRAIYRLAEPLDIWAEVQRNDSTEADDVPKWVKALITPLHAKVTAIAIEYGLHQGRYWLPRAQSAEGEARAGTFRVPVRFEQGFRYASVNAIDSLPRFAVETSARDSLWRVLDTLTGPDRQRLRDSLRVARRAARDSIRDGTKVVHQPCDTGSVRVVTHDRHQGSKVPVAVRIPCNQRLLAISPDLPASIYDSADEMLSDAEREALIAQALSLSAQPEFGLQPPVIRYGAAYTRYNRVEGLSIGAAIEQQFGRGFSAVATGRLGLADLEPAVELSITRTNLIRSVRLTGYNRLVAANDWGDPLSFSSSLGALLWGRDDGFYYRTSGLEVTGSGDRGMHLTWRFFAEQQRSAAVETQFSLANAIGDAQFEPNLVANRGTYVGTAVRLTHSYGLNPADLRALTDLRFEVAGSDVVFGRAAMDVTISRGLGRIGKTPLAGSVTLGGGTTTGDVPPQRLWYLGGTHSVRGQRPGAAVGDAYWLGRAELGLGLPAARPVLFGDWGWAGDRARFDDVGRPLTGVGLGASFLDGIARVDVARGIHPERRWTVNAYLESRF